MTRWIDITRPLVNGMIRWPGDPPFEWRRTCQINRPGTCNFSEIRTGLHVGTHIDAPLHFVSDGADVSQLALERLCGRAVVLEVAGREDVTVEDVVGGGVQPGDRVLIRTANRFLWNQPEFKEDFTGITPQAAQWMVDQGVPVVGVDYLSVDRYADPTKQVHYALLGAGVVVIEGLDLDHVAVGRYEMVALPLVIPGAEASPARVIIRALSDAEAG